MLALDLSAEKGRGGWGVGVGGCMYVLPLWPFLISQIRTSG